SFFFQAEDGIRDFHVTGVQTCALPIYRVAILGRRQEELEATAELAGAAYSATCDVTDPSAVHRYFSGVLAKLGRVDVVFNNAGRFSPAASFCDIDVSTWQVMIDVILIVAFYVARD